MTKKTRPEGYIQIFVNGYEAYYLSTLCRLCRVTEVGIQECIILGVGVKNIIMQ